MIVRKFVCKERREAGYSGWRPRGTILKFVGTYMMFKNGKGRFSGRVTRVLVI
jgi:hypothetical protein